MLVLADRYFYSVDLWDAARGTGAGGQAQDERLSRQARRAA
jgi:hypothetical protein